jgi:hypothetical protein
LQNRTSATDNKIELNIFAILRDESNSSVVIDDCAPHNFFSCLAVTHIAVERNFASATTFTVEWVSLEQMAVQLKYHRRTKGTQQRMMRLIIGNGTNGRD